MQIVDFDRTPDPALYIAMDGDVERVSLDPGRELAYPLGERRCAGTVEDGRHRPCARPETPWCPTHTETWICARCSGTCLKDEMDCFDSHVVYLAIVAPRAVKVGVTKTDRFETRIHEQGADRAAVIHEVSNGRIAREIEAETALPERMTIRAKIEGLTQSVDEAFWTSLLADYDPIAKYRPSYDLARTHQPIPETLGSGRVIGTKGRLLVMRVGGTPYVTDLRALVGHRIVPEAPPPERQSGLEAFG